MTCDISVPTLGSIYENYWYFMKRNHILWIFKILGPFYKPHDYNFKRINFKHKNIGGTSIPPS